ncbi:PREDICTED: tetraspanin-4-like, partial [Fulmarus glacialis]|uniref:tetraspanin-4-like n=1 Tax=Fulmarus glacialis TaxID=30455 RepID=UPI00051C1CBB
MEEQLGGCGILGVGIWLAVTQGNFATLSSSFPSLSAANLLIVTGTFVMIIGFVGCIGAIKENKCLLLSFFIMLLIIFLLELTVVILFFVYTDKTREFVSSARRPTQREVLGAAHCGPGELKGSRLGPLLNGPSSKLVLAPQYQPQ